MPGKDFLPETRMPVRRGIEECAIVAIVGERVPRRVLEIDSGNVSLRRCEGQIAAIDECRQGERREILVAPQREDGRGIAHAVVDAEIDVARLDARLLE